MPAEVLASQGACRVVSISAPFSPDGLRIVTAKWWRLGENLGREDWCRDPSVRRESHSRGFGAIQPAWLRRETLFRAFGVIQPGRFAGRDCKRRWDCDGLGRETVASRRPHAQGPTAMPSLPASFSPDGLRVVTCNDHDGVKVWDSKTGAEIRGVHRETPVPCVGRHSAWTVRGS